MVCPQCIIVIERELREEGFYPQAIELGVIEFKEALNERQISKIESLLLPIGFKILHGNKEKQIEEIKNLLIIKLQDNKVEEHFSVKKYLSLKI